MEPGRFTGIQIRPASRLTKVGDVARWTLLVMFVIAAGLWSFSRSVLPEQSAGIFLLCLGTASALVAMTPALPLQNALLAGLTVFGLVFLGTLLDVRTGLPFGTVRAEQFRSEHLLWIWPALWVLVLLTARGVAVICLRPWRRAGNYGWRALSLTMLLAMLLELQLEACAAHGRQYWRWEAGAWRANWYGTPLLTFWGWTVVAGVACVLMTPSLIQKSPAPKPFQLFACGNWLVLQCLCMNEAIRNGMSGVTMAAAVQVVSASGWILWVWQKRRAAKQNRG